MATAQNRIANYATYPPQLIRPCILAGSEAGDAVLDSFFGTGTTGVVAAQHGRHHIGIELNPESIRLAEQKILYEGHMQQEMG